jgi:hypothetical protein
MAGLGLRSDREARARARTRADVDVQLVYAPHATKANVMTRCTDMTLFLGTQSRTWNGHACFIL